MGENSGTGNSGHEENGIDVCVEGRGGGLSQFCYGVCEISEFGCCS